MPADETPPPEDTTSPRERFEEALREHVASSAEGAFMTDYVVIAAGAHLNNPNETVYVTAGSDGPPHHRLGLVRRLMNRTDEANGS